MDRMEEKLAKASAFVEFFKETSVKPEEANPVLESLGSSPMKQSDKMFKVFARPNITLDHMKSFSGVMEYIEEKELDREILEQTEIEVKYSGYIEKERNNADKLNKLEDIRIPERFDYR